MRGTYSPYTVCWIIDLLESICKGVLYFVIDRVAGFAFIGYFISNGDVELRLFIGGALDFCFDYFTAFDGSICSLGEST